MNALWTDGINYNQVLLVLPFSKLGIGEMNIKMTTGGEEGGLGDVEGDAEKERVTQLVMESISKLGELQHEKDILTEAYMADRMKLEQLYQPLFQDLHQQVHLAPWCGDVNALAW